jgi:hypothetical protein
VDIVKYWLLNTALEFPCGLGLLFPVIESEALNVKEISGIRSEDYAASLVQLYEAGLIMIDSPLAEDQVNSKIAVTHVIERFMRRSPIERGVRHVTRTSRSQTGREERKSAKFQLTTAGGQEWERYAKPDWDHYLDLPTSSGTGAITSQNRDLVIAVMGFFPEIGGGQIDLDSVAIQEIRNYSILYWKRLPSVFKATFRFEQAEARWGGKGPAWSNEPTWFKEWWAATNSWYIKPWESPEWPSE